MKRFLLLIFPLWLLAAPDATLKISKDVDQRAGITVLDAGKSIPISKKLHHVFLSDLKISGNFIPDKRYRKDSYGNSILPTLRSQEYILKYQLVPLDRGATLRIKLMRAANTKVMLERKYRIPSMARFPFAVHKAVTDLNDALGYRSVAWINRYVVFTRYTGRKQSEILLADYTFNFTKTVVRGGLNLFPQWGDSQQQGFYYTSYETGVPTIYHLNIYTGRRRQLVSSEGMLICSDVSRDGKRLLLTMAPEGQPDIYEYTVATGNLRRLTTFSGIDVNGKYSDNGRSLVFVSNRLGNPNIYKKKLGGTAVSQLIFHGKKNSSCDTYGGRIVYASKEGAHRFNIYLADSGGGSVRPLTSMGTNQFPRFAPDGNTVLYIKRNKGVNAIGYIGLQTNLSMLFPLGNKKIQSIDW